MKFLKFKKRKRKKKENTKILTFTKRWVAILLVVAMIDIQLPFIMAFMGYSEIAETLAVTIVTEIIGVSSAYMCKAFFETKHEELNKLERDKMKLHPLDQVEDSDDVPQTIKDISEDEE